MEIFRASLPTNTRPSFCVPFKQKLEKELRVPPGSLSFTSRLAERDPKPGPNIYIYI